MRIFIRVDFGRNRKYRMNDIIKALQDKDDKKAYALSKEIETKSAKSDEYSSFFD